MRTPQTQSKHDSIVSGRARELLGNGYKIWADVGGYVQPGKIFGHIPDIIAVKNDQILISEVETSDSYSSQQTKDQLRAFDLAGNYSLEVVVPRSVYEAAVVSCNAWGVSVDSWRTFEG